VFIDYKHVFVLSIVTMYKYKWVFYRVCSLDPFSSSLVGPCPYWMWLIW